MAAKGKKRAGKGVFGRPKLSVAKSYVVPPKGRLLLGIGLLLGLMMWAYAAVDHYAGGRFLSGGPLSSGHALLERDCAACHGGFEAPADAACASCHEKYGDDLGTYSFASHYLYRSNDFQRVAEREDELTCAACHGEHRGRDADITAVVDARCITCHTQESFADGHPEFAFAEEPEGDDDALSFGHGFHVRELMQERGWADVEKACLVCHRPSPDGRLFEPIAFDEHCGSCHLAAGTATPRLAVAEGDDPATGGIGVETLQMIRTSNRPGVDWAFYTDPTEFREAGSSVTKTTIYHSDPWILHNLRRLRGLLYGDTGLADLLVTTPDVPESEQRRLYREAATTLREQIRGLRGTPGKELQNQVDALEALVERVEESLEDPFAPFDETEFLLALGSPEDLSAELREEAEVLIGDLTAPCVGCHWVEDATIVRVDGDQRTLKRAEFDHRAHVIQRRCLDCHHQIPILDVVEGGEPDPAVDHAGIHNLPTIDSCRECHGPGKATASCVSCHFFHPDAARRGDLLRYVDPEDLPRALGLDSAGAESVETDPDGSGPVAEALPQVAPVDGSTEAGRGP